MTDEPSQSSQTSHGSYSAISGPGGTSTVNINIHKSPFPVGTAPLPPALFLGRENDLSELHRRLTSSTDITPITAVRGWPGVGKTSLVAALAHDPRVRESFPNDILWAALGPNPDLLFWLGEWLTALGEDPLLHPSVEGRSTRLAALLRNRKALLVVDDVWEATHARPFCVGGSDCRMLITTREPEVALGLGIPNKAIYRLSVLPDEEAFNLLRELAPDAIAANPEGTRRLANVLEGLPLALQVAGRLLASEASMGWGISNLLAELEEGTRLLQTKAPIDRANVANQTTLTVAVLLQRSTDRLDRETRERFASLGVFVSKPATFDAAAASAVWKVDDPRPTLRTLVSRGLIEPVPPGRFQMHALLTIHARTLSGGVNDVRSR